MSNGATNNTIAIAKTTGYITAVSFFDFLGIPQLQIGILACLVLIDVISGILKQWRIKPSDITSNAIFVGVMKKITIFLFVVSVAFMLKGLELDGGAWLKTMLGILIMGETYSITQNIYAVNTGIILPEYDVISIILKKVGLVIQGMIDKNLKINK